MFIEGYKNVLTLCDAFYSEKKKAHAERVERYVTDDTRYALMKPEDKILIRAIALAHDLLEDTKCLYEDLNKIDFFLADSVKLLTHVKPITYYDYCNNIIKSNNSFALIVKTADLKDHLTLTDTLTPKLIKKYDVVIPLFIHKN